MNNAFHYPYGVKIKCALGLNNTRKIKISKKSFGDKDPDSKRTFDHLGVSPIKEPSQSIKAGLKNEGGISLAGSKIRPISGSAFSQRSGVFEMALTDRIRSKAAAESGAEYVELGLDRQSPKAARIIVHNLQRFSETDKIVKNIRGRNIVFVGLKAMKQANLDELKQSVAKINKVCAEAGANLSLVEEEWLIVTPQTAAIV